MKKINSILAIAAVALTSVVGFTSCDKNDDALSNQTPVVKGTADTSTTADSNNSSSQSDLVYMKAKDGNQSFDTSKNVDTSYSVGEWTATINDTVYTLVVSSDCSKHDANAEYKATLHVGDKTYDGVYMTPNFCYSGRFDSYAKTADGKTAAIMVCPIVNESTLSEMTATFLTVNDNLVLADTGVKFVKK